MGIFFPAANSSGKQNLNQVTMSSETNPPSSNLPDWNNLEAELARSFQPAWTKGGAGPSPEQLAKWQESPDRADRADRGGRSGRSAGRDGGRDGGFRRDRPPGGDRKRNSGQPGQRPNREQPPHSQGSPNAQGPRGPRGNRPSTSPRPDRREHPSKHGDRRHSGHPAPAPKPILEGWKVEFFPDEIGLHGLARQIKQTARAYALFDLARLVLDHPARYQVRLRRANGPTLHRCTLDGSLWLQPQEAIRHALAISLEKFYRREVQTVETIKGNFNCVARCGLSGTLLGPPNHHEYQINLRRLHAEKFARMPFAAFQARVQMVREEAVIEEWKTSQSTREVFFPLPTEQNEPSAETEPPTQAEAVESTPIPDRNALLRDFQQRHGNEVVAQAEDEMRLPGQVAAGASAELVSSLVRQEWEKARRFPLALAHACGQVLAKEGLQLFKAHENFTYAGVSRPHALDRQSFPVSDSISQLLTIVEERPGISRADLRQAVENPGDGSTNPESPKPSSFTADLSWLLHQGHLVDFAGRGLESANTLKIQKPAQKERVRKTNRSGRRNSPASSPPNSPASPDAAISSPEEPTIAPSNEPTSATEVSEVSGEMTSPSPEPEPLTLGADESPTTPASEERP